MDAYKHIMSFSSGPTDTLALAPLDLTDGAAAPPEEFLLIRYGENDYTKGEEGGRFAFGETDADAVL
jgi:hypothetical protein